MAQPRCQGLPGLFKTGPLHFRKRKEKTLGIMAFCHTAILEIRLIVIEDPVSNG